MRKCLCLILAALLIVTTGCKGNMKKYSDEYFGLFDTIVTFIAFADSKEDFERYSDAVYTEMERLHALFDIYNDYEGVNNIKTINDNAGVAPVRVDASIIDMLEHAKTAYIDTDGVVNVALGPVLEIWHDYRTEALDNPQNAKLPPMDALQAAAAYTNIDGVIIDREASTVFLGQKNMSLDVGALAKGYAAQSAVDRAKEAGLTSGILNAGGNVCAVGSPMDGRAHWSVGVNSPELSENGTQAIYDVVYVGESAVVTSGDYQRFYVVDGVSYHHIIDPKTLMPANHVRGVSIIHPDGTTADILSTAAFILPYDEAYALIEKNNAEAIWIFSDGEYRATPGYLKISQKNGAVS